MTEHIYFAYGSNMNTDRLESRVGKVECLGRARLFNWRFFLNKRGADGTGKGNIARAEGLIVWGVGFLMSAAQIEKLDNFEPSYERFTVQAVFDDGESRDVLTYASASIAEMLPVCPRYLEVIIAGARDHGLPEEIVAEYITLGAAEEVTG